MPYELASGGKFSTDGSCGAVVWWSKCVTYLHLNRVTNRVDVRSSYTIFKQHFRDLTPMTRQENSNELKSRSHTHSTRRDGSTVISQHAPSKVYRKSTKQPSLYTRRRDFWYPKCRRFLLNSWMYCQKVTTCSDSFRTILWHRVSVTTVRLEFLISIKTDTYGLYVTVHRSTKFTSICDPMRLYLMRTLKRWINWSNFTTWIQKILHGTKRAIRVNASRERLNFVIVLLIYSA